jgi:cupin superfamily acireductone dioxygenase involved in methionine salvage
MNEELNKFHKISGLTPLSTIISNGNKDMVDYVLCKIFLDRDMKIDITKKDNRGRNILHQIIGNKHLSLDYKLEILNKNIAILTDGHIHNPGDFKTSDLYNEIDNDGLSPLTAYICQLTTQNQKTTDVRLTLEFLIERTDFEKTIFKISQPPLVHPFIPCIQITLEDVFKLLLELKPELQSTVFFCDYVTGRTTLEYAFTTKNLYFIEQIIEALNEIDSFVVHNDRITLFDVCETIFRLLKDDGTITGRENVKKHDNKIFALYQKLVAKVYTETKAKSGSKAENCLQDFKFLKKPKTFNESDVIKLEETRKIDAPKMPKRILEKAMQASIKSRAIHQENEARSRKITDYASLFSLAFKNDNFITLPYISEINPNFKIGVHNIVNKPLTRFEDLLHVPAKKLADHLYLTKHKVIFELILGK